MQPQLNYSHVAHSPAPRYQASMELSIHIRQIRLAKGLTQKQLAEKVGVSDVHVSQVERGVRNLNNHLIKRFAAALEVEPADLIRNPHPSDDFQRLSGIMRDLREEDRARVEAFASALRQSGSDTPRTE